VNIHGALLIVLTAVLGLYPTDLIAQTTACSEDYEKAQEERASGHLNAALSRLRGCVNPDCPKFIREDCARWMDQTEAALPSVVFAVRRDGVDQTEVEVTCDGIPIAHSIDGKAVPIDPGIHVFLFNVVGFGPIERQLVIREGERNRILNVEFRSPHKPMPTWSVAEAKGGHARLNYLTYGLAGAGALGLVGFTVFAILGSNQQGDLERKCSPYCEPSQVDSLKTKYLIADTCLAVGLVSLGAATYLYFSKRDPKPRDRDRAQTVALGLLPRSAGAGGMLQLTSRF
jgi:hypothetical protein